MKVANPMHQQEVQNKSKTKRLTLLRLKFTTKLFEI